jgi:hypothetical protein
MEGHKLHIFEHKVLRRKVFGYKEKREVNSSRYYIT